MRLPVTSDAVKAARVDCWCESYRKPCEYHEGWEDGYETASVPDEDAGGLPEGARERLAGRLSGEPPYQHLLPETLLPLADALLDAALDRPAERAAS